MELLVGVVLLEKHILAVTEMENTEQTHSHVLKYQGQSQTFSQPQLVATTAGLPVSHAFSTNGPAICVISGIQPWIFRGTQFKFKTIPRSTTIAEGAFWNLEVATKTQRCHNRCVGHGFPSSIRSCNLCTSSLKKLNCWNHFYVDGSQIHSTNGVHPVFPVISSNQLVTSYRSGNPPFAKHFQGKS
jgi:hypothetical protein